MNIYIGNLLLSVKGSQITHITLKIKNIKQILIILVSLQFLVVKLQLFIAHQDTLLADLELP